MPQVLTLYRSSVGKKILMALTGVLLVGFIVVHMLGNLKLFEGPSGFNAYAAFLREVGYPALPHSSALWGVRVVLLVALIVHVWMALDLWRMSAGARPQRYAKNEDLSFSYASRTMRWGGVIIFLFLVYHILHFTTGQAHHDYVPHDVYHNFVTAFRVPWILLVYVAVPPDGPTIRQAVVPAVIVGIAVGLHTAAFGLLAPFLVRQWLALGIVGSIFIALVWFNLVFQALLYGAAFTRLRRDRDRSRSGPPVL